MTTLAPFAIFLGACATVVFTFFSFWGAVNRQATKKATGIADQLDRAGILMKPQEIVLTVAGSVALAWIAVVLLLHPPLLVAAFLLPVIAAIGVGAFYGWLQVKTARRLDAFITQSELALRLMRRDACRIRLAPRAYHGNRRVARSGT